MRIPDTGRNSALRRQIRKEAAAQKREGQQFRSPPPRKMYRSRGDRCKMYRSRGERWRMMREAAGTTTLSKSWYSAWLTRPNLNLDERNFNGYRGDSKFEEFSEFAKIIIQSSTHLSFQQVGPYESVVLPPELFEAGNFIGISVDWCKIHNLGLDRKGRCSKPKPLRCNFYVLQMVVRVVMGRDTRFSVKHVYMVLWGHTCLALAIVFTWRLLRAPRGPQRRQFKRQAPSGSSFGVSNRASVNDAFSEVTIHLEDSGTHNVIDELFQPVKPTLIQIVRQMLCEGRKVTCRLLGVILDESSPEELQVSFRIRISEPFCANCESTRPKGHCVAARVKIEDPDDGFKPTTQKRDGDFQVGEARKIEMECEASDLGFSIYQMVKAFVTELETFFEPKPNQNIDSTKIRATPLQWSPPNPIGDIRLKSTTTLRSGLLGYGFSIEMVMGKLVEDGHGRDLVLPTRWGY
ncbi:peroxisome biogenesis protein 22 [Phtheirospermum japonicum]|uniref:Peroxisome biogenesis protein 22 n=1 Tax=Phtheirospermum japonicum TaxID=374723 RepID=A0A830DDB1_9LAMI|nr:peroxisome biogenesis protein 22 [Phtheirospermum japonicum]